MLHGQSPQCHCRGCAARGCERNQTNESSKEKAAASHSAYTTSGSRRIDIHALTPNHRSAIGSTAQSSCLPALHAILGWQNCRADRGSGYRWGEARCDAQRQTAFSHRKPCAAPGKLSVSCLPPCERNWQLPHCADCSVLTGPKGKRK